jgi:hypothetical protein
LNKKPKKYNSETAQIEVISELLPLHKRVIDIYFNNGFNKVKAYQEAAPGTNYNTASCKFQSIEKRPEVKMYIQELQKISRDKAELKHDQIARELEAKIAKDRTIYAGLTPEQLQQLPEEAKKPIKDVKYKTKTYTNEKGETSVETVCEVVLYDELEVIKELNKMRGNYGLHNQQKGANINVLLQSFAKDSPEAAYKLLQAITTEVK